jgi:4-hydroxyproline epimerase
MESPSLRIIDSHTGGEPTRVVISGGPDLGAGTMAGKAEILRRDHDWLRSSVCNEPRGHEAMVGALLCEAHEPDCLCGVIFFNNVSNLGMCIHGTIGVMTTLASMGRITAGAHRLDTPVGVVTATLHDDGRVEVENVPSRRTARAVSVEVPGWGTVTGDVAWGGNWFFLIDCQGPEVRPENISALTDFTWAVRQALEAAGVTGDDGGCVDHIESFGPPTDAATSDSRNFVLCPGKAYDRSPCGTGTSAKLACLHADGKLRAGEVWWQAGIVGSVFEGTFTALPDGSILPRVSGRAWVNGEAVYHFDPHDPFRHGIPAFIG